MILELLYLWLADSVVVACGLSCPVAGAILVPRPGVKPASPGLEGRSGKSPGKQFRHEKIQSSHVIELEKFTRIFTVKQDFGDISPFGVASLGYAIDPQGLAPSLLCCWALGDTAASSSAGMQHPRLPS